MDGRRPLRLRRGASALISTDYAAQELACHLRWTFNQDRADPVDLDLSALKFSKRHGGRYVNAVYFADKQDIDNGIFHGGDEILGHTGRGDTSDCETILFNVGKFTRNVDVVIITASVYSSGVCFDEIDNVCVAVEDTKARKELCSYDKESMPRSTGQGGYNAVLVGAIYRRGRNFAFRAIDEPFVLEDHQSARYAAQHHVFDKWVHECLEEHTRALEWDRN